MDFKLRVGNIKAILKSEKLDAVLISSNANIIYLTGYDNFSLEEREAWILITKKNEFILTDGRYTEAIKKGVPHFKLLEISQTSSLKELFIEVINAEKLVTVGMEENDLRVKEYNTLSKIFKKLKPVALENVRVIKTPDEITSIEKACRLGDKVFTHLCTLLNPKVSEKELSIELEAFLKKQGADISFKPIIAFFENSAVPHHQTSDKKLGKKTGQFVLMDLGAKINGYCSDMTRTIFYGEPTDKQKKIYQTVLEAQQKAIEHIQNNLGKEIKASEADQAAREHILSKGYSSIPHSLGHGIGLQVHETPYLSSKSQGILKEGMVFSIEPGIYIPGFGGVRIEDLFVIEKKGLRQLTRSPKS